jgi:hypothetical protein
VVAVPGLVVRGGSKPSGPNPCPREERATTTAPAPAPARATGRAGGESVERRGHDLLRHLEVADQVVREVGVLPCVLMC